MRLRSSRWLAPLIVLALAVALRAAEPAPVQELQHRVFDTFQRLAPRPYQDAGVRIVDIDDASLERIGQWPWSRLRVAELVSDLFQMGAAVVVFDIVFAEPDRTSPARLLEGMSGLPVSAKLRSEVEQLPDHDAVLARAFSEGNVVTGFVLTNKREGRAPATKVGFSYGSGDPFAHVRNRPGTVVNLAALEAAAAGNGAFTVDPDTDGIHRRVPLLFAHDGVLYPSLAAEGLRVATGGTAYSIRLAGSSGEMSFGEDTGISQIRIGKDFTVPTNSKGEIWVWYTDPTIDRSVPAWQVLTREVDPKKIEGHIVLIGTSAEGLGDMRATPVSQVLPGVAVHAQIIEQILLGEFLDRPDWAPGAEMLYLIALGLLLVFMIPRFGAVGTALLGAGAIGAAIALSWYAYTRWHWLLDPVYPAMAGLGVYLVGSLQNYLASETQRRQVRGAFSRYLSPGLVDELAENPEKLRLGGEMREMTLLFCDVRGFTTISEELDPHSLTRLVNRFLTPMTDLILARRGFIDKYMGDCIMAFWNAPLDDPAHPRHGCDSALAMVSGLRSLNAEFGKEADLAGHPIPPLAVGIGLNTGLCCVGNMGSDQRFDYSVISDEVNLASRLEGQSKSYGVSILMGENTRLRVPELAALELDLLRVKGKTRPVRVFALLGAEDVAARPEFAALVRAQDRLLAAYRGQRWEEAQSALEECRRVGAEFELQDLYALYEARIAEYRATPPPPDWDGVHIATTK
jgi:adenylate cyclase